MLCSLRQNKGTGAHFPASVEIITIVNATQKWIESK